MNRHFSPSAVTTPHPVAIVERKRIEGMIRRRKAMLLRRMVALEEELAEVQMQIAAGEHEGERSDAS